MDTTLIKCPRCQCAMHEGFVFNGGLFSTGVGNWYAGAPKMPWLGRGIGLLTSRLKCITAYRCEQCSYLELYAP